LNIDDLAVGQLAQARPDVAIDTATVAMELCESLYELLLAWPNISEIVATQQMGDVFPGCRFLVSKA